MNETAKIEVKINNISSGNCQVKLILYCDSQRKNLIPGGSETESAFCNSNTN